MFDPMRAAINEATGSWRQPVVATTILWFVGVVGVSGQSLLDPKLTLGQIMGRPIIPGLPVPAVPSAPSAPVASTAPAAQALEEMSAEELQVQAEFNATMDAEARKGVNHQSWEKLIPILEKGLEACKRNHREDQQRTAFWYQQLLIYHQLHGDVEDALKYGLLAVAKLKKTAAAAGLPEGSHATGGGGVIQGRSSACLRSWNAGMMQPSM